MSTKSEPARQPIANIHFRLNKDPESVIQLKAVTPAELMLLCAMHRVNNKNEPVVKLVELPETHESGPIKVLEDDIAKLELLREEAEEADITEEVREKRIRSLSDRITGKQAAIEDWRKVRAIRAMGPGQERVRLCARYNENLVKKFYPGGIPTLPRDFKEALELGSSAEVGGDGFLVNQAQMTQAGINTPAELAGV